MSNGQQIEVATQSHQSLLEIDLGDNGGHVRFDRIEQAEKWQKQEREFWDWLLRLKWPEATYVITNVRDQLARIANGIKHFKEHNQTNVLEDALRSVFIDGKLLHSRSRAAGLVQSYRDKEGDEAAAMALGQLLQLDWGGQKANSRPSHLALRSAIWAETVDKLPGENLELFHQRSERLISEGRSSFETLQADYLGLKAQAEQLGANMNDALEQQRRKSQAFFEDAAKRKDLLEKTYDEHMTLQAPVEYWAAKARSHYRGRWIFGSLAFIFLAGGASGLIWFIFNQFPHDLPMDRISPIGIRYFSMAVVGAISWVWLTRILVRLFLSHTHLETDASEREVMTKTYLALIKDGKIEKGEDRAIILSQLFRHAATGVVTEDAVPQLPISFKAPSV